MRLRVGSAFGVPIYIHWTFLLLPLWIWYTQPSQLGLVYTLLPLVFACVVMHEFGHVVIARYFGIGTQDVTLYPIGGVARLRRMTDQPLEEFLIAVAGPAVNVLIGAVLVLALLPLVILDGNQLLHTFAGHVALLLLGSNVAMVLFNLLPAFPMDGGRVLRALLASVLGHYQGTRIAVGIGMGMAALMGLAGIMLTGNIMLTVIAVFIFFAGQQELMAARIREKRRLWDEQEPLEVLPVRRLQPADGPPLPPSPAPALMIQPKISVYTWDNHTGTWRKDPGT